MDRPDARPAEVLNEVFDLLVDLGADDHALDFPVIYASGREGWADDRPGTPARPPARATSTPSSTRSSSTCPCPQLDADAPLQVLITTLDYSDYVGRIGIGRVFAGTLQAGPARVLVIDRHGEQTDCRRIAQLFRFDGLGRIEVDQIDVGDICAVVGLEKVDIGDTLADPEHPDAPCRPSTSTSRRCT